MIPLGDDPRRHRFPWITIMLIAANVIVFLYELTLPDRQLNAFVAQLGAIPVEILSGRDLPPFAPGPVYLTLLSSMFIHGGFLHIGSNMLYLWVFGDNIEDVLGHLGFLGFYLVCGVLAGLTHAVVNAGSEIPSVGASGAVAGVLGAYLLIFPHAQIRTLLFLGPFILFPRISAIIIIGVWFVTQLLSGFAALDMASEQTSGIAFWAHIGGFVAGFALAVMVRPKRPRRPEPAW